MFEETGKIQEIVLITLSYLLCKNLVKWVRKKVFVMNILMTWMLGLSIEV